MAKKGPWCPVLHGHIEWPLIRATKRRCVSDAEDCYGFEQMTKWLKAGKLRFAKVNVTEAAR